MAQQQQQHQSSILVLAMDIVAENFESVGLSKVPVEDASKGRRKVSDSSSPSFPAGAVSSIQAPFLPSSEPSAPVSSPSPVQLERHSLFSHIPVSSVSAATLTAAEDARAGEMSVTSVEASTTASVSTLFSSCTSVVSSSAPRSVPNDTAGLVVAPSSSSALDLSGGPAPGIALTTSLISSFPIPAPTYSPSLTTSSVSLATATPYSSADMIQAPSRTQSAGNASLGFSPLGDTPQPAGVPSAVAGLNSSGPLLTPSTTSLAAVEGPLLRHRTSSPQVADMAEKIEASSFSPIEVSEHQQRSTTVLPSSSSPADNITTAACSESQPGAPCLSNEEKLPTALPSPSQSNLEVSPPPIAPLPSPDVRETTDPVALSPSGASTGVLSEHERTSLETSTSFPPSGTSTITIPSPALISKLPATTFPSLSISKIPNPSSVFSSNRSSVRPMIASSMLSDPASAYSSSRSYLALLSSVEKASSSSPLAGRQMPQYYPQTSPSLSSHPTFGQLSTSNVISDSTDSSCLPQEPISDISLSGNLDTSTTGTPSIVSIASAVPLVPTSLNSSSVCNSASSYLPAGSGDSMDFSPPPSSHFTNVSSSHCESNTIQVSPSSLELKSIKEGLTSKSGPPVVPTSKTLPRRPVRAGQKGEGWPYALQGWPEPDDKWPWRVGKRVHVNGYFRDRFLGLPKSLCKGRKTTEFASKKSIVEYLKENFPDLSVENFFKSFQWRIPYVNAWNSFSGPALKINTLKRQRQAEEDTDAHSLPKRSRKGECKAGNPNCGLETGRSMLLGDAILACDVCCTEPGFCRECKCILCCKTIAPDAGESNFVRCLVKPSGSSTCGHAAHLECALHSKMAGVVKKRGLDMEYLCRRCDNRTDLRELVTLLLEAVGNTEVRIHAENSLELALKVMKGTERGGSGARVLEALVQAALRKVISGVDIQEVFKELKDQGAAAEAARQHHLGRSSYLMEDASQQPEASLDQWLPSAGSPSSHPSPGTPSSFTSPRLKSHPSVTSGQINGGTQTVDGSLRKHRTVEGHTDHFGEPLTSNNEVVSNSKYKNSHLGNKSLMRNAGQARGTHRIRAVSSNVNKNGLEAICDSFTTRTPGDHVAEPGSWDGNSSQRANQHANSGSKNLKDQRNSSSGAGKLREENEMCKSCGASRRHTANAVEITSSRKSTSGEDGGKKVVTSPSTPQEDELGDCDDSYRQVAESDTGVDDGNGRPRRTCTANGSAHKSMGTSLQMVDRQCEQEMRVALQKLRRAQEAEFQRAEACLAAKKKSILRKYELLEATRREFSEQPVSSSLEAFDELLLRTGNQFAGAREERDNFKIMLKVAEGFGSVSKDDLKQFYRWPPEK